MRHICQYACGIPGIRNEICPALKVLSASRPKQIGTVHDHFFQRSAEKSIALIRLPYQSECDVSHT
jgi:hypothetical protein